MLKFFSVCFFIFVFILGCSKSDSEGQKPSTVRTESAVNEYGLTEFEMKYGIGPVKERIFLGRIDKALAKKGEDIFATKCAPCHKLDERYIGPAQRYATERKPPEYILNMILNPDEMTRRHPEAQKVLAEYLSPMTFQNMTLDDAKLVLEYLRLMAEEGREKNIPEVPLFRNQQTNQ